MAETLFPPLSRVQEVRLARGLILAELARRAEMQQPTLSKIDLGQRNLSPGFAPTLAKALGVPIEALYAPIGSPIPSAADELPPSNVRPAVGITLPPFGSLVRDLPVWGSAEGGSEGSFELLDGSTLGHTDLVRRPPGLIGVPSAFALYVFGDSMSPWREPGDLVYINPGRPPAPGNYVVVVFHPTSADPYAGKRAMVKKLLRRSASFAELEQFNPAKTFRVPTVEIESMYRVVGSDEAMGNG